MKKENEKHPVLCFLIWCPLEGIVLYPCSENRICQVFIMCLEHTGVTLKLNSLLGFGICFSNILINVGM